MKPLLPNRSGADCFKLFKDGCDLYERASGLNASDFDAACNHGDALVAWAQKVFEEGGPSPQAVAEVMMMNPGCP